MRREKKPNNKDEMSKEWWINVWRDLELHEERMPTFIMNTTPSRMLEVPWVKDERENEAMNFNWTKQETKYKFITRFIHLSFNKSFIPFIFHLVVIICKKWTINLVFCSS